MVKMKHCFALALMCSSTVHAAFRFPAASTMYAAASSVYTGIATFCGDGSGDFSEDSFNNWLNQQSYFLLEKKIRYQLNYGNEQQVYNFVSNGAYKKKDPLCFYKLVRFMVKPLIVNTPMGTDYIQIMLRNMIISLILLAGDLTYCIFSAVENSDDLNRRYIQVRNVYANWYAKALKKNNISFQGAYQAAIKWLQENGKIEQPSPFWCRHFQYDEFKQALIFNPPTEDQLRSYENQKIKELVTEQRSASAQDFIASLQNCDRWETFFGYDLLHNLNREVLHKYVAPNHGLVKTSAAAASTAIDLSFQKDTKTVY